MVRVSVYLIKYKDTYLFHEHQRDGGQQGDDRHKGKLIAGTTNPSHQFFVGVHEFVGFVAYQKCTQW